MASSRDVTFHDDLCKGRNRWRLMAGSLKRQRRAGWSAKLTRSVALTNADKLVTLADARRVVLDRLTIEVEDFELTQAMRLLLTAADTGRFADRDAATNQVGIVLRWRGI
jgi:hypothetical protein